MLPEAALEDLFTSIYDGPGLRRFVTRTFGRAIADGINWNIPDRDVRFEVAQMLARNGLIEPDLFVALWRDRQLEWAPAREAAAACGVALPPKAPGPPRAPVATEDRVAVRIDVPGIDPSDLPGLLKMIRTYARDARVTMESVQAGSVILHLGGPREALARLVAGGTVGLSAAIGMLPVTEVRWLKPPGAGGTGGGKAAWFGGAVVLVAVGGALVWRLVGGGAGDTEDGDGTEPVVSTNLSPVPVISAAPSRATSGALVTLDGSGSHDPDGTIAAWTWDFGDGSTGSGSTTTHAWTTAGTQTVRLTVVDDGGSAASTQLSLEIVKVETIDPDALPTDPTVDETIVEEPIVRANLAPVAEAGGPYRGQRFRSRDGRSPAANEVRFDASGSTDPDGDALSFTWGFGDATQPEGSTERAVRHRYARPGTYTATLTVTDRKGASASDAARVTIENRPPTARITSTPSCEGGIMAGVTVVFDGSASTDDFDEIQRFRWSFSDGTTPIVGDVAKIEHTFKSTETITLIVEDADGERGKTAINCAVSTWKAFERTPTDAGSRELPG